MQAKNIYIILFFLICAVFLSLLALGMRYKYLHYDSFFDTWREQKTRTEFPPLKPLKTQPNIKFLDELPQPKPLPNTKRLIDNLP